VDLSLLSSTLSAKTDVELKKNEARVKHEKLATKGNTS
jgi:hypothetical protein